VLPDETPNVGVFSKHLVQAIGVSVIGVRPLDGDIVDKRHSDVRDFKVQDVGDVLMKNRY